MIESSVLMISSIFIPVIAAGFINLFSNQRIIRNCISPIFGITLCAILFEIGKRLMTGEVIKANLFEILPSLPIGFELEPLGFIFASLAGFLWVITSIYSIGYLQKSKDKNQSQFFIFLAISISVTLAIAYSGNLFSMFIFYELLTFLTYPLVIHKRDNASLEAGKKYLLWLVGTSILLFLPAIITVFNAAGDLDLIAGGILPDDMSVLTKTLLLIAFAYGIGKAALMPFHWWLPAAMVAPTPVSALLHAVAVVKAGVFCIVKIVIYIFGTENLNFEITQYLSYIAVFSIIAASVVALLQDNLKKRLAYSTISQLAYVVLAISLVGGFAATAAMTQIVAHGFAKITLFFAAGAIITCAGVKNISDIGGVGKKMPITMACFLIASLSLIGVPLLAGAEAKDAIMDAAIATKQGWVVYVLYISAALNAAYLLPISYKAFVGEYSGGSVTVPKTVIAAIIITSLMVCGLGFFSYLITDLTGNL